MGQIETKEAELMNKIEENVLHRNEQIHAGWVSCDALVPAVMLSPKVSPDNSVERYLRTHVFLSNLVCFALQIATESKLHFCRIELNGFHTRGQMVLDHPRLANEPDNVLAVTKIDLAEYESMLLWGIYGKDEEEEFSVNNHIIFAS